jgi:hypothetical protein
MRWARVLGFVIVAAGAGLVSKPTPVSAYPPQCINVCQPNDSCSKICYEDLTRSTCGDAGMSCVGEPSFGPTY